MKKTPTPPTALPPTVPVGQAKQAGQAEQEERVKLTVMMPVSMHAHAKRQCRERGMSLNGFINSSVYDVLRNTLDAKPNPNPQLPIQIVMPSLPTSAARSSQLGRRHAHESHESFESLAPMEQFYKRHGRTFVVPKNPQDENQVGEISWEKLERYFQEMEKEHDKQRKNKKYTMMDYLTCGRMLGFTPDEIDAARYADGRGEDFVEWSAYLRAKKAQQTWDRDRDRDRDHDVESEEDV